MVETAGVLTHMKWLGYELLYYMTTVDC